MHFKIFDDNQVEKFTFTKREQVMRREKYLKITKSEIYKNHNSQKLNIFVKVCQIVFNVRSIIYNYNFDRINFAKSLLSNNTFDSSWDWQKYRRRLNEIAKSSIIWKNFCDFFKKQISSIKLRITTIDQKIKLLHQKNNQTIAQLIVYFETLEKQWLESISNFIRISNLFLFLHEYLRKKIIRKNVK